MLYTKANINTIYSVSRETEEKLNTYTELLLKWQKAVNLISPNTINEVWHRHIADSMQLFPHIPNNTKSIVDLGSGGGLPAVVLAIMFAGDNIDTKITMVESDTKKCAFLNECVRTLKLNAIVLNERIENIDRGVCDFDMAIARALAKIDDLLAMCQHLGADRGLFLKGESFESEIESAKKHWQMENDIIPSITAPNSAIIQINSFKKI